MPKKYTAFQHPDGSYASTTDESFQKFFGECKRIQSGLTAQKAHTLVKQLSAKQPRKHNPNWKDSTRTERSNKRKAEMQAAAELNGFLTWSGMMTYIKNQALQGKATVSKDNA
jgi:hypothetical protein